ncbi:MAG TPA: hypothetical protein VFD67_05110 [Gemmatimonadaceae bacterium]|nr:hypothetical protein [Gemmatimonadaceae bacterium]
MAIASGSETVLFRRREDRDLDAITDRIRAIVSRQSGHNIPVAADSLKLPALDLARLLGGREAADPAFVIDVITALAYEAGVDSHWVLTGEYDGAAHRQVLMLGEEQSAQGRAAVRELVHQQYRRLRRDALFSWWPLRKSGRQPKAQSTAKSA